MKNTSIQKKKTNIKGEEKDNAKNYDVEEKKLKINNKNNISDLKEKSNKKEKKLMLKI